MNKISFSSVIKFKYKNNQYEMFKTLTEKIAFLKIENGKYIYPTKNEFEELIIFFSKNFNENFSLLKKMNFLPLLRDNVQNKLAYVMITSSLVLATLTGCGKTADTNIYAFDQAYQNEETVENEDIISEESSDLDDEIIIDLYQILKNESIDILDPDLNDLQDDIDYPLQQADICFDKTSNTFYLFNDKYFDYVFETKEYSLDDIYNIIDSNNNIPDTYKSFIKDYTNTMYEYYKMDLRVFGENLKNLNIVFMNEKEINEQYGCLACFDAEENKMILQEKFNLSDSYYLLILRHELTHLFNNINIKKVDYSIKYYFNYNYHGMNLKEGLTVLYSSKPFLKEYEGRFEKSMGYPLTTNLTRIIVDSIDYDFNDFISSNVYSFEKKLADTDLVENANLVEDILEYQNIDYYDDSFELDKSNYYYLYSNLSNIYINNNINTTDNLKDEYIKTISKGVNIEFFDEDIINETFDNNYERIINNSFVR